MNPVMKHFILFFFLSASLTVLLYGCKRKEADSLPPMTIGRIQPDSATVNSVIRITGSGYGNLAKNGTVNFNGVPGTIVSYTSSILQVKVPSNASNGIVTISGNGKSVTSNYKVVANNTGVEYITALTGKAGFSKFATLSHVPTALHIDKIKDVLYYTDAKTYNDGSSIYKLSLSGGAEQKLSSNQLITNVKSITTDVTGNVYALVAASANFASYHVYKITADGSQVKLVVQQAAGGKSSSGRFFVNTMGDIILFDSAYNASGQAITSYQPLTDVVDAAFGEANLFYYLQNGTYQRYDMGSLKSQGTDINLNTLFAADDYNIRAINTTGNGKVNVASALDQNDNLYAVYQHSFVPDQLTNNYFIRKTKNGNGGQSMLISAFTTVFSTQKYKDPQTSVGGILFAADADGNLYLRYNDVDIIKISATDH
jgi:hypothetical protein